MVSVTVSGTKYNAIGPATLGCSNLKKMVGRLAPHIGKPGQQDLVIGNYRCAFHLNPAASVCRVRGAPSQTVAVARSRHSPPNNKTGSTKLRRFYTRLDFCQQSPPAGTERKVPADTPFTFTGHVYAVDGGPVGSGIPVRFVFDGRSELVKTTAGGAFQDTHTTPRAQGFRVVGTTIPLSASTAEGKDPAPPTDLCSYFSE